MMTLLRRLEMIFGGPARAFPLTVTDADRLANAIDYYADALATADAPSDPGNEAEDAEIDAQVQEELRDLQRRLYAHAGFDRLARTGMES